MKCRVCNYSYSAKPREADVMHLKPMGTKPFIKLKEVQVIRSGKMISLLGCPKCGTIKIDPKEAN